ncbi:hypothetical protein ACWCQQ_07875 [Streptomyces sp. NPDC002143]
MYDLVVGEGLNLHKATVRLVSEGITDRSGKTWTRDNLRDRIMSAPVLDAVLVFRGKHAKSSVGSMPRGMRTATPSGATPSGSNCLGS